MSANPAQALLKGTRDALSGTFSKALWLALPGCITALQDAARDNDDADAAKLQREAALGLQRVQDSIADLVARDVATRFDGKLVPDENFGRTAKFSLDSLTLIDDDQMQEDIVVSNVSKKLREQCDFELYALHKRVAALADLEATINERSPAYPSIFVRATLKALADLDCRGPIRMAMFEALGGALPDVCREAYHQANQYLIDHDVLIEIKDHFDKPVIVRSKDAPARAGSGGTGGGSASGVAPGSGGGQGGGTPAGNAGVQGRSAAGRGGSTVNVLPAVADGGLDASLAQTLNQLLQGAAAAPAQAMAGLATGSAGGGLPSIAAGAAGVPLGAGGAAGAAGASGSVNAGAAPTVTLPWTPALAAALARLEAEGSANIPNAAGDSAAPSIAASAGDAATLPAIAGATTDTTLVPVPANILHRLNRELAPTLSPLDLTVADLVAAIFDRLFDEARLPGSIKAVVARLQIPLLKLAMQDRSVFTDAKHPARALIDTLIELGLVHAARLGDDSPALASVREVVETVYRESLPNAGHFATAAQAVRERLAQQDEAALDDDEEVRRLNEEELARAGRRQATLILDAALTGRELPPEVMGFIRIRWHELLVSDFRNGGAGSPEWQLDVGTLNDLLSTTVPPANREEHTRLVSLLPSLLPLVREAISRTSAKEEETDGFLNALRKLHTGMLLRPPAHAAPAKSTRQELDKEVEALLDNPALKRAPTAPIAESTEVLPSASLHKRGLGRGVWVEFDRPDASKERARITWISPAGGTTLFKIVEEKRSFAVELSELLEDLDAGRARIVDGVEIAKASIEDAIRTVAGKQQPA